MLAVSKGRRKGVLVWLQQLQDLQGVWSAIWEMVDIEGTLVTVCFPNLLSTIFITRLTFAIDTLHAKSSIIISRMSSRCISHHEMKIPPHLVVLKATSPSNTSVFLQ